jgi:hypothetical protein
MAELLPNGNDIGHEVFITGYNNNGTYEYFDPESGTYKSTPLSGINDAEQIYGLNP